MVSASTLLTISAIGLFLFAGGLGLTKRAVRQAGADVIQTKLGVTEQVKNIRSTLNRNGVNQ